MTSSALYALGDDLDPDEDSLVGELVFDDPTIDSTSTSPVNEFSGDSEHEVVYTIDLPTAGDWYLWGRFYFPGQPTNDANSFAVSVDGGSPKTFGNLRDSYREWHWHGDGTLENGPPTALDLGNLSAGSHSLSVRKREILPAGAEPRLDVLYLTKSPGSVPLDEDAVAGLFPTQPICTTTTIVGSSTTTTTLPSASCGDGTAEPPAEECDGSDDAACPGACTASCTCVVQPGCGNGLVDDVDEECDDGNNTPGDGCSSACQLESTAAVCEGVPTSSSTTLGAQLVTTGLNRPLAVAAPPLDTRRVFIATQPGEVWVVKDGVRLSQPFIDLTGRVPCCTDERGLLGIAFHPSYEENGWFFLYYVDNNNLSTLSRFTVSADPDVADVASEKILLTVQQPAASHNGGQILFGDDGYLYWGLGDGQNNSLAGRGQDPTTLLAKILRIDVDVESSPYYAIPPDNPGIGSGDPYGLIWAMGTRNPWRFTFDSANGDFYLGDVGQVTWEEIDYVPAAQAPGTNFGWDFFEGNHCYEPKVGDDCPDPNAIGVTMPIYEWSHSEGCAAIGGIVYRGCAMPNVHGTYFFGDYCSGFIRSLKVVNGAATNVQDRTGELDSHGLSMGFLSAFGVDARGEIYVTEYGFSSNSDVYKIVPVN
jgi:cysteine-rich repeat protein